MNKFFLKSKASCASLLICAFCLSLLPNWMNAQFPVELGQSSNIFSVISNQPNPFVYDANTSTMVFIHRNDTDQFDGTSSEYRFDVSTDEGLSWEVNLGPLASSIPGSGSGSQIGARYPQAALHTTSDGTTYLVYIGATLNGMSGMNQVIWDGIVAGVANINGEESSFTENLIPLNNDNGGIGIVASLINGVEGEFWALVSTDENSAGAQSPTTQNKIIVLKGVWNDMTNDVDWSEYSQLNSPINESQEVVFQNGNSQLGYISSLSMDFDPTGQYGWILFSANLENACGPYAASPVFYRTEDGGESWLGPISFNLNSFNGDIAESIANIESIIESDPSSSYLPTLSMYAESDIVVDINGHPHATFVLGPASEAGPQFNYPEGELYDLFHLFYNTDQWQLDKISEIESFNAEPITSAGGIVLSQASRPQMAKTLDAVKIVFSWSDGEAGSAERFLNMSSYDLESGLYSESIEVNDYNASFYHLPQYCKSIDNEIILPYTYIYEAADVINTTNYAYDEREVTTLENYDQAMTDVSLEASVLNERCEASNGSITMHQTANNDYTFTINGSMPQSSPTFDGLSAGVYEIVVTDSEACETSVNLKVEKVGVYLNLDENGDLVAFISAWENELETYWTDEEGNIINDLVIENAPNGCYTFTADFEGESCSIQEEYCIYGVGIENAFNKIDVYPNPAKSNLFIEHNGELTSFVIKDQTGRVLNHDFFNSDQVKHSIDISSLPTGMFMLEVHANHEKWIKKFIKD